MAPLKPRVRIDGGDQPGPHTTPSARMVHPIWKDPGSPTTSASSNTSTLSSVSTTSTSCGCDHTPGDDSTHNCGMGTTDAIGAAIMTTNCICESCELDRAHEATDPSTPMTWPAIHVSTVTGGVKTDIFIPSTPTQDPRPDRSVHIMPQRTHIQPSTATTCGLTPQGSEVRQEDPFAVTPLSSKSPLPALPTFEHLPPSPLFRAGADDAVVPYAGGPNIFRPETEKVFFLHRIDDTWRLYLRAIIVARQSDHAALRSLLAWGWNYRVAKSLITALLSEREVHEES